MLYFIIQQILCTFVTTLFIVAETTATYLVAKNIKITHPKYKRFNGMIEFIAITNRREADNKFLWMVVFVVLFGISGWYTMSVVFALRYFIVRQFKRQQLFGM